MKNIRFFIYAMFITIAAGCGQQQAGTDAEVSEAKEVKTIENAKQYTVNASESIVSWIGSKPTGKHNGTIPIRDGSISVVGDKVIGGKVLIDVSEIKNADLADDHEKQLKLINHLKSADFFDAEKHPVAEFVITSIEEYDEEDSIQVKKEYESEYKPASAEEHVVEAPTHKITGNLTMRGKTLSIAFPAKIQLEENKITAKAKFNIDRTLWGLQYGDEADAVDKAKDKFIYNTVNVGFDIIATAGSTI